MDPQNIAPYLTQHSADPDWPLQVGIDERGRSIHVCADCGAEIPDGLFVERRDDGRVIAYSASHDYDLDKQAAMQSDSVGNSYLFRERVEVERTVHHDCGGPTGG